MAPPRLRALDARRFRRKKGGDPSCTLLIRLLVRAQSDARSSLVSAVGQDAKRNSCQTHIIVHGKQGDKREAGSGEKRERVFANLRWAERGTQAASTALTSICALWVDFLIVAGLYCVTARPKNGGG